MKEKQLAQAIENLFRAVQGNHIVANEDVVMRFNQLAVEFNSLKLTERPVAQVIDRAWYDGNRTSIIAAASIMLGYLEPFARDEITKEAYEKLMIHNRALQDSLAKFSEKAEFPLVDFDLSKFPEVTQTRLIEAVQCFNNGTYIATCVLCGTIMEGIILDKTKSGEREFKSINERTDHLISKGIIQSKETTQIAPILKEYRDHAAHPTSEVFDKKKARLFLNSLLFLVEDCYRTETNTSEEHG